MYLVELLLGFLVDDANARSSSQIMEIIESNRLPCIGQLIIWVGFAIEPCQRGIFFSVQCPLFAVTHVPLVLRLGGLDTAVILKVQFALPGWNCYLAFGRRRRWRIALHDREVVPGWRIRGNLFLNSAEEALRRSEFEIGNNLVRLRPVNALVEDCASWASAVVA